jgi:PAS domain S-box-containing protein
LSVRDALPTDLRAAALDAFRGLGVGHEVISNAPCVRKDGSLLLADIKASAMVIDGRPCVVGFFSDFTDLRRVEAQRDRLIAAVEQTSDSVVITDLDGTIEYINPAFERASGYQRAEVIGANPRIVKSGHQSPAFYRALWRRLTSGRSWAGTLINRRKDGSLYEEEAVISPIRGVDGTIVQYVAVKRDVTALRAAESSLAREFRERAEIAAALARLQPTGSAEGTATEICDELIGLPGIDLAAVIHFIDPRRAVTLAATGPDGCRRTGRPTCSAGRPRDRGPRRGRRAPRTGRTARRWRRSASERAPMHRSATGRGCWASSQPAPATRRTPAISSSGSRPSRSSRRQRAPCSAATSSTAAGRNSSTGGSRA